MSRNNYTGKEDEMKSSIKEKYNKTKFDYLLEGRQLRTVSVKNNLNYNEELRVYFTLLEYGMKNDLSFQKQLIELLKKKNMINVNDGGNTSISNTNNMSNNNFDLQNRGKSNTIRENSISGGVTTGGGAEQMTVIERSRGLSLANNNFNTANNPPQVELLESEKNELENLISTTAEKIENQKTDKIQTSVLEEILNQNLEVVASEIQKYEELEKNEGFDKLKFIVKEKERLSNVKANIINQTSQYEVELNE